MVLVDGVVGVMSGMDRIGIISTRPYWVKWMERMDRYKQWKNRTD